MTAPAMAAKLIRAATGVVMTGSSARDAVQDGMAREARAHLDVPEAAKLPLDQAVSRLKVKLTQA
jgi:hypothetical protein